MPQRRNENLNMVRSEPMAYSAQTFVTGGPTYEAWAEPGAALADAKWIACKHTYDGDNNLIQTEWAKDSSNRVADFTNVATTLSALTYV